MRPQDSHLGDPFVSSSPVLRWVTELSVWVLGTGLRSCFHAKHFTDCPLKFLSKIWHVLSFKTHLVLGFGIRDTGSVHTCFTEQRQAQETAAGFYPTPTGPCPLSFFWSPSKILFFLSGDISLLDSRAEPCAPASGHYPGEKGSQFGFKSIFR